MLAYRRGGPHVSDLRSRRMFLNARVPEPDPRDSDRQARKRRPLSLFSHVLWAFVLGACTAGDAGHPWLDLGDPSPHEIVEFSGANAGQIVIAMDPAVTREEALALGRLIQSQAPPGATVNARLYDHEPTARGWRQAPAEMRIAHLLVVVSINPATDLNEVRWVRPDEEQADLGASTAAGGPAGGEP